MYRILRRLGEGGMGTVFEAEQSEPRRRVALKVLRQPVALTDEGVRLFRREAQALGRLRHPAIATIYEAGQDPDGTWFLAMELAVGSTLSDWLASRPLESANGPTSLTRRLGIFRQICAGVAYAHQRGVIHRDLKPSNVMVRVDDGTRTPTGPDVKILDFGLALILDETASHGVTDPGLVRGTIAYMSPEQAGGNPQEIDVRTDVYALGIVLYEMLTGQLPHDLHGLSPMMALARVSTAAVTRPVKIWEGLGWRVDPDLEAIVLKAIARDPDERYQTVAALGEDLDRLLAGLPILARPPRLGYQLRKLVQRHRGAATATLLTAAAIAATAVVATVQRNRARAAEATARAESEKSASVVTFIERMLGAADPYRGSRDVTVVQVLDAAAKEVETSLAGQTGVEVAVRNVLGRTFKSLGRFAEAEEQFRTGLRLVEQPGAGTGVTATDLEENLAELRLSQGRLVEAEALITRVLARREAEHGADHPLVAKALTTLGAVAYRGRFISRADSLFDRALGIRLQTNGPDNLLVAEVQDNLATVRYEQGRLAVAESLFRRSLTSRRSALRADHPDVATTLNNLAMTLKEQRKFADAEPHYREALAINQRAFGDAHPRVAQSLNNLGMFYYGQKRYREAVPWLEQGVGLNERIFGRENVEVASGLNNLGLVAREEGRFDDAIRLLREAADIQRRINRVIAQAQYLRSLGSVYDRAGRSAPAEASYREAIEIQKRNEGTPGWEVATTTSLLGDLLVRSGRLDEAERALRASFPIIRAQFGDASPRTKVARDRLVGLYRRWGKPQLADSVTKLDSTITPQ